MKYLITGGGTGGHIYPALAIAAGIKRADPKAELLYVGTKAGLESDLVPRAGIPFQVIDAGGIMGKSPGKALSGAVRAVRGIAQATGIIRRFGPDVAIGTGGYVSGPVMLMARMNGVPCAIQEQNAVPGFTNRMLSRISAIVFTPFEGTQSHFPDPSKCVLTGNPVREEIVAATREEGAKNIGLNPSRKTLFIFGGSRGARRLVEVAVDMISGHMIDPATQILFVTGREYESMALSRLAQMGIDTRNTGNLILRPYLFSIEHALAASDLLIGRAGGMTVSEVLARGLPSILVPSPNVANNHQFYNARAAERTGGSILIREQEFSAQRVASVVGSILGNDNTLRDMADKARSAGRPQAIGSIVAHLKRLAGEEC